MESKKCYICSAVRRPAKAERAVLFINPSLNNIVVLFIDFAPVGFVKAIRPDILTKLLNEILILEGLV